MSILVAGTSHKYSPIQIREKLSFPKKKIKKALISLSGYQGIEAGVILSTCNRVELYASSQDLSLAERQLKKFLCDYQGIGADIIKSYLYVYQGRQAIDHLFRVACGLDSQIIGESQILEQVESAYRDAREVEATNRLLDSVFDNAIRVSGKVRRETGVAKGKISLARAVSLAIRTKFPAFRDKRILMIGVGRISELITAYLKKEGLRAVFIAGRNFDRAVELAKSIDACVVRFDSLKEQLKQSDIVISATSSSHFILRKEDIPAAKPLLIIDLALPRDVDPQVKQIEGVSLLDLDSLGFLIRNNLSRGIQALPEALSLIEKEAYALCESLELAREPAPLP